LNDGREAKWRQVRRQASSGFVGLMNRMVDHPAYGKLSTAASVKALTWFWQKVEYDKHKRRPGQDSPIGRTDKIRNNGEISFTYEEAHWRGLSNKQFSRALKELFKFGFIDIRRLGHGVRGEWTRFALSDRWKKYGTPEWEEIPFPENRYEGFRVRSRKKGASLEGCYPTALEGRYEIVEIPNSVPGGMLETAVLPISQQPCRDVFVDLAIPIQPLIGEGMEGQERERPPSPKPKILPWTGTAAQRRKVTAEMKALQKAKVH
jgi:hypothetical protein